MEVLRVHIKAITASFRYPTFITGHQPTLPIPPLSTIYGIISAAKGDLITPHDVSIGYVFKSNGKGTDLETIYELKKGRKAKSNIIRREFLFEPELFLYIKEVSYHEFFKEPFYPLLIGRSDGLAKVKEISFIELVKQEDVRLGKTLLPFGTEGAHGIFHSLPTYFTESIPRKARDVRPFIIMDKFFKYKGECFFDIEKEWGIWFYGSKSDMG